ncbi:hypothetical protein SAMN02800694_3033 [Luteibacter sp. UNCMF331Sha3.1]|nr:hypothetical protein SAMN02800694_3033 [Luteibacter sp. UNCMF331Sha3.1]
MRSVERSVKPASIVDTIRNPLKVTDVKYGAAGRPSIKAIGAKATVTINPDTGKIVTVNPTRSKLANRLIREKGASE